MTVEVRPRQDDDLPVLLDLLGRSHRQDGYPVRAAAVSAWWLADDDELGSWVAVSEGRLLGHVALHPPTGAAAPLWREGTGRDDDGLAVVSRLFTDRTVRGAGTALLTRAVEGAGDRSPVLEVDVLSPAHGLYLRQGWLQVGTVVQQWGHRSVDSAAMVHPSGPVAR